jgi:hypothetical protein
MKPAIIVVDVDVAALVPRPPYRPKYAVLRDRPLWEVKDFARANPGVFVFPFYEHSIPDFSHQFYGRDMDHVVQPMYVGNVWPVDQAIEALVKYSLGCGLEECDKVEAR